MKHTTTKPGPTERIIDLLDILGYGAGNPARSKDVLLNDLYTFLDNYLAHGNSIPYCPKKRCEPAVQCALQFLQDSHAEKFWPADFTNNLVWPSDRECIVEALGHIIRRKIVSNRCCSIQKDSRERKATMGSTPKEKRKRKRNDKTRERVGDLCKEVMEPTKMKMWNQPPIEPGTKTCVEYVRSLDPEDDTDISGFTKQWLADENATWPMSSISRVQRFMHKTGFYISPISQGNDESPSSIKFANTLRLGTEIADIPPKEIAIFLKRFDDQVKALSMRLAAHPTFVLEYHRREGTIQKTERFSRMWNRREEFWSTQSDSISADGAGRAKRRISESDVGHSRIMDRSLQEDLIPTTTDALKMHDALLNSGASGYVEEHMDGTPSQHTRPEDATTRASSLDSIIVDPASVTRRSPTTSIRSRASRGSTSRRASKPKSRQHQKSLILAIPTCLPATAAPAPPLPPLRKSEERSTKIKCETPQSRLLATAPTTGYSWDVPIMVSDDESNLGKCQRPAENGVSKLSQPANKLVLSWPEDREPQKRVQPVGFLEPKPATEAIGNTRPLAKVDESFVSKGNPGTTVKGNFGEIVTMPDTFQTMREQVLDLPAADPGHAEWVDIFMQAKQSPDLFGNEFTWIESPVSFSEFEAQDAYQLGHQSLAMTGHESSKVDAARFSNKGSEVTPHEHEQTNRQVSLHENSQPVSAGDIFSGKDIQTKAVLPDGKLCNAKLVDLQKKLSEYDLTSGTTRKQDNSLPVPDIVHSPSRTTLPATSPPPTFDNTTPLSKPKPAQRASIFLPTLKRRLSPKTATLEQKGLPRATSLPPKPDISTPVNGPFTTQRASTFSPTPEYPILPLNPKHDPVPRESLSSTPSNTTPVSRPALEQRASTDSPTSECPTPPPTAKQNPVLGSTSLPPTANSTIPVRRPGPEQRISTPFSPTPEYSMRSTTSKQSLVHPVEASIPISPVVQETLIPSIQESAASLTLSKGPQPTSTPSIEASASASVSAEVVPFLKHDGTYALIPATAPFSTQRSPSDQPLVPATKVNPDQRLYQPIAHRDPNVRTLELIIELEDGSIDFDNVFPFQNAKDSNLKEFFDFYSTVAGVPLPRLTTLRFSVAFGQRQLFKFHRLGDEDKNERNWQRAKNIFLTKFNDAQKVDRDQREFQILVGME